MERIDLTLKQKSSKFKLVKNVRKQEHKNVVPLYKIIILSQTAVIHLEAFHLLCSSLQVPSCFLTFPKCHFVIYYLLPENLSQCS